jgi:hypothetical protein
MTPLEQTDAESETYDVRLKIYLNPEQKASIKSSNKESNSLIQQENDRKDSIDSETQITPEKQFETSHHEKHPKASASPVRLITPSSAFTATLSSWINFLASSKPNESTATSSTETYNKYESDSLAKIKLQTSKLFDVDSPFPSNDSNQTKELRPPIALSNPEHSNDKLLDDGDSSKPSIIIPAEGYPPAEGEGTNTKDSIIPIAVQPDDIGHSDQVVNNEKADKSKPTDASSNSKLLSSLILAPARIFMGSIMPWNQSEKNGDNSSSMASNSQEIQTNENISNPEPTPFVQNSDTTRNKAADSKIDTPERSLSSDQVKAPKNQAEKIAAKLAALRLKEK